MIVFALDTESVTPPVSGARYEIDRREDWFTRYVAALGREQAHAQFAVGLPVHNFVRWRSEFTRALASVVRDSEAWLATRPAANVVQIRKRRA